jgi:hypothetical protein
MNCSLIIIISRNAMRKIIKQIMIKGNLDIFVLDVAFQTQSVGKTVDSGDYSTVVCKVV